jgi:molybdopterin synthase catalytic subunit
VAELAHAAIDTASLIAAAARPDSGAIAIFLGTTRDHHQGRRVTGLAYEAYEPMALAALAAIEETAGQRHAITSCRIVHRLGEVPLAEASVVVIATAHHREAAFDACRWAMDELKRTVPIWKRESFADGDSEWVAGTNLAPPQ